MNRQKFEGKISVLHVIFSVLIIVSIIAFIGISIVWNQRGVAIDYIIVSFGAGIVVLVMGFLGISQFHIGRNTIKALNQQVGENETLKSMNQQLKEQVEEANHANEAKSAFLNAMASQLRTPLSTILGMGEMLSEMDKNEEQSECIHNIHSAGTIMESLLNDLSDLAKIEKGQLFIEEDAYSMADVIRDTYTLVKPSADRKSIDLQLQYDENFPSVLRGDQNRMKQVIMNLLSNAVSYTPIGSIIYCINYEKLLEDKIVIKVEVKDSGIGIKQEDMQKFFNQFTDEVEPVERVLEGMGLGLTVTNQILQQMGSYLEVESEYGQGSVFSFRVVAQVEDETPVGPKEEVLKSVQLPNETEEQTFLAPNAKVLAVDDNRMNLAVINGLLKKTRMQVDCVTSGAECLEAVKKENYDLILLDHMMPDLDGITTLRKLKQLEDNPNTDIPVIVITASAAVGVRDFYLRAGFTDYISKPIGVATLFGILRKHLPENLIVNQDAVEQNIAKEVMIIQEDIAKEISSEDVKHVLMQIKRYMTDFDIESAHQTLEEFMKEQIPEEYEESFTSLKQLMDLEQYEKAAVFLEQLLKETEFEGKQN